MSHDIAELQMKQAAPLSVKIKMTQQRIREWVNHWGLDEVYVSFSGGKDSTVLLTIAREMYPSIKAVFIDTGLEYPEIRDFVRTWDNVDWVKPKMNFKQVIEKYGYPFISKEVSECVYGARKYLTYVAEQNSLDRPTDRPHKWNAQCARRLFGQGEYAKDVRGGVRQQVPQTQRHRRVQQNESGKQFSIARRTELGGVDQQRTSLTLPESEQTSQGKSMPLSGTDTQTLVRQIIQQNNGKHAGGGNAPWRFGAVCGVLTAQNTFDARLSKHYRQLPSAKTDGDSSAEGQGDNGDYP